MLSWKSEQGSCFHPRYIGPCLLVLTLYQDPFLPVQCVVDIKYIPSLALITSSLNKISFLPVIITFNPSAYQQLLAWQVTWVHVPIKTGNGVWALSKVRGLDHFLQYGWSSALFKQASTICHPTFENITLEPKLTACYHYPAKLH